MNQFASKEEAKRAKLEQRRKAQEEARAAKAERQKAAQALREAKLAERQKRIEAQQEAKAARLKEVQAQREAKLAERQRRLEAKQQGKASRMADSSASAQVPSSQPKRNTQVKEQVSVASKQPKATSDTRNPSQETVVEVKKEAQTAPKTPFDLIRDQIINHVLSFDSSYAEVKPIQVLQRRDIQRFIIQIAQAHIDYDKAKALITSTRESNQGIDIHHQESMLGYVDHRIEWAEKALYGSILALMSPSHYTNTSGIWARADIQLADAVKQIQSANELISEQTDGIYQAVSKYKAELERIAQQKEARRKAEEEQAGKLEKIKEAFEHDLELHKRWSGYLPLNKLKEKLKDIEGSRTENDEFIRTGDDLVRERCELRETYYSQFVALYKEGIVAKEKELARLESEAKAKRAIPHEHVAKALEAVALHFVDAMKESRTNDDEHYFKIIDSHLDKAIEAGVKPEDVKKYIIAISESYNYDDAYCKERHEVLNYSGRIQPLLREIPGYNYNQSIDRLVKDELKARFKKRFNALGLDGGQDDGFEPPYATLPIYVSVIEGIRRLQAQLSQIQDDYYYGAKDSQLQRLLNSFANRQELLAFLKKHGAYIYKNRKAVSARSYLSEAALTDEMGKFTVIEADIQSYQAQIAEREAYLAAEAKKPARNYAYAH